MTNVEDLQTGDEVEITVRGRVTSSTSALRLWIVGDGAPSRGHAGSGIRKDDITSVKKLGPVWLPRDVVRSKHGAFYQRWLTDHWVAFGDNTISYTDNEINQLSPKLIHREGEAPDALTTDRAYGQCA
jgi:hypothetical protein